MKQNIKNPLAARQAATVQPGRADSDFDAAKYTPAPLQSRPLPNEQWTQPAVGNPNVGIQAINDNVRIASAWVEPLRKQMARVIVGQDELIDRLMVGLISNGHILLEGVPGLAKTLADEINRAPAKVQGALLEAMQERQVTVAASNCRATSAKAPASPFTCLITSALDGHFTVCRHRHVPAITLCPERPAHHRRGVGGHVPAPAANSASTRR